VKFIIKGLIFRTKDHVR